MIKACARTQRGAAWTGGRDLLATHRPGAMKQSSGCRHRHQRRDLRTATGLTEHRDVLRIAAELLRVIAHPGQCLHEIENSHVARTRIGSAADTIEIQMAEDIEPMIDGDHDNIAALTQASAIVYCARS